MNTLKDNIYSSPLPEVPDFTFDSRVAQVFDDMISRSVPAYKAAQIVSAILCKKYHKKGTLIYDLGCSTGTTLQTILEADPTLASSLVGIDNSAAMLDECLNKIKDRAVTIKCQDVVETEFAPASLILLNFTLQFIKQDLRSSLLKRINQALVPGGLLVLSEKLSHPDQQIDQLLQDLHYDFKLANAYSALEIAQKREAIENILVPLSTTENIDLLQSAGFKHVDLIIKHYNFGIFLAVK